VEDHHVDRPDVETRQRAQLTGTNRSFDLIVLIIKELLIKELYASGANAPDENRASARARARACRSQTGSEKTTPKPTETQFCFKNIPPFAGLVALARR
jgi:hypothetical protein